MLRSTPTKTSTKKTSITKSPSKSLHRPKTTLKSTSRLKKSRFSTNTAIHPQQSDNIGVASVYNLKGLTTTSTDTSPVATLATEYDPSVVESHWDNHWQTHKLFTPSLLRSNKFTILLPPPNVTGTLHLGHALTVGIQDTLTRFKRMSGHSTLWVPGVDHAGIATQVVVEKQIKKLHKKTRHDFGREEFVKLVWEWKEKYGDTIFNQLRRLGTSLDWSRSRFTLDSICEEAVVEAFNRLYDDNVIYRDNRIVSWCCTLSSAISAIEIDQIEITQPTLINIPNYPKPVEVGVIHDFKYKIVTKRYVKRIQSGELKQDLNQNDDITNDDNYITIATTRMETMLGDVAVAVHPDDPRYHKFKPKKSHLTDRTANNNNGDDDGDGGGGGGDHDNDDDDNTLMLEHPIIPNYFIPVIFDDVLVDMNFGTGAVKITPAHDPNDYACALRNELPLTLSLLDDKGHFSHPFHEEFNGEHRYDVREKVIDILTKKGLYKGKRANPMALSVCSRSGDLIEPMIKPQWWIRSDEMMTNGTKAAKDDVEVDVNKDGVGYSTNTISTFQDQNNAKITKRKLSFTPANSYNDWARWLSNNQDWCISRQLWWGHRIPAWYMTFDDDDGGGGGGENDRASEDAQRWVIAKNENDAQNKAQSLLSKKYPGKKLKALKQDEDVLDTWFSSGLFPFSVMGWPHNGVPIDGKTQQMTQQRNKDFLRFFPGSLLETGNDILFFWVARMVMLSQTLTGALPFEHVYLHTLIRDKLGRKMSKSLGNVIDPIDVIDGVDLESLHNKLTHSNLPQSEIEKVKQQQTADFPSGIPACGSDSLRFGLLSYTRQTGDINLDLNNIVTAKHFKNKIWQAMRFTMSNIQDSKDIFTPPINGFEDIQKLLTEQATILTQLSQNTSTTTPEQLSALKNGTFEQQWILHRLAQVIERVNDSYEKYQFGDATAILQKFFIEDLCSRYLEISKTIVRRSHWRNGVEEENIHYNPVMANTTLNILYFSLQTFLKLLHPISPYITEELWFSLPGHQNRVKNETNVVENDIVRPILQMLTNIEEEYYAQNPHKDENNQDNVELNQHVNSKLFSHLSQLNSLPISPTQIQKYLDISAFDINTYKNRVDHINKVNDNNLKYQMNPAEQLLSPFEIRNELNSLALRTKAGSISTQAFPTLQSSQNLQNYYNNTTISTRMDKLMDIIEKVRVVKARLQIPNHIKPKIILEYITPDNINDVLSTSNNEIGINDDIELEKTVIENLNEYQHIISILSFVSSPTMIQSKSSNSSLVNQIDYTSLLSKGGDDVKPSSSSSSPSPSSPSSPSSSSHHAIKQYISDRILCHILIDSSESSSQQNENTTPSTTSSERNDDAQSNNSIDLSPELVKSERRYETLTAFKNNLEAAIEKTKTNPKVPEKIKIKNQLDYSATCNEMVILEQNITSLRQIVPVSIYKPVKIADLNAQIAILQKNKDKVQGVINDNVLKGKGETANVKHQETLNGINDEIGVLQDQIDCL